MPGLKVAMPATVYDAKGLLKSSVRDNSPVVFMWNQALYDLTEEVPEGEWIVPLGEACVRREGSDVRVVTSSNMAHKSLLAAEDLDDEIGLEVVDVRTVVPLDIETILKSVRKDDTSLAASFLLGVPGAVAALPVIAPSLIVKLYDAAQAGRIDEAHALQKWGMDLFKIYEVRGTYNDSDFLAAQKAALELLGIMSRWPAPPCAPMGDAKMVKIQDILLRHDLPVKQPV